MNFKLKNLLGIFLSLFISQSLWSMEPELGAPDWEQIAQWCFGEDAKKYYLGNKSWREILNEIHQVMPSDILKIDEWEKEKISNLLLPNIFRKYEVQLLKHIENKVATSAISKIDNVKDLAAALLAYEVIFFENARGAARGAVVKATDGADWSYSCNALKAILAADWGAAGEAASEASGLDAWNKARKAAWGATREFCEAAITKILHSLYIIDIKDEKAGAYWKLSNLFMLAYISQENFANYFPKAFMVAKKILDGDASFNMNKNEIIETWEKNTWGKAEFEFNPYIQIFKNIALRLAAKIND